MNNSSNDQCTLYLQSNEIETCEAIWKGVACVWGVIISLFPEGIYEGLYTKVWRPDQKIDATLQTADTLHVLWLLPCYVTFIMKELF